MRALLILGILVSTGLFFSGCTESSKDAEAGEPAKPAVTSDDLGGIEGYVMDEESVPVSNAQIGIRGTEFLATADGDGKYSFSLVPPGTYSMDALRLGYHPSVTTVTVVAGEVTPVDITLAILAAPVPYAEIRHHTGKVGLGVAFIRSATCSECGSQETSYWNIGGIPEDFAGLLAEATWDTDDSFGFDFVNRDQEKIWYRTRGESPMRFIAERCKSYLEPPAFGSTPMPCEPDEVKDVSKGATLETWYLGKFESEAHALDPVCQAPPLPYKAGCYGVGVAQDLTWETYLTIFHLEMPPDLDIYSSLPDA
jgi:carboxypeptidase family protein